MIAKSNKLCYKNAAKVMINTNSENRIGSIDSDRETPSYISNLEVKSVCGEGSARGTECENSKTLPLYFKKPYLRIGLFFCLKFRKC